MAYVVHSDILFDILSCIYPDILSGIRVQMHHRIWCAGLTPQYSKKTGVLAMSEGRKEGGSTALLSFFKSRDPHLAGGEHMEQKMTQEPAESPLVT